MSSQQDGALTVRRESWLYWAVGLAFGAIVGAPVASFGPPVLMTALAIIALAYLAAYSLALLSGALIGLGGIWLALLIRARLACEEFDARAGQECELHGIDPWLAGSVIVLVGGIALGAEAWRRRMET
jgi:hypothetical protein